MFSRPWPIIIISITLIALGALGLVILCMPTYRVHFGSALPFVLVTAANLAATGLGLWRMRRWAPVVFTVVWVVQWLAIGARGASPSSAWFGLAVVWGVCLPYWRRLD